jgi:type II restriction/modification system DNA methylase subunit YeeA
VAVATIPADKALYQRQIEATDRQIDALVYELYGLTDDEIAIVEREK